MNEYFFTFGSNHAHPRGYYVIEATNMENARIKMFSMFGHHWAFCYSSFKDFGVEEYNLKEVGRAVIFDYEAAQRLDKPLNS